MLNGNLGKSDDGEWSNGIENHRRGRLGIGAGDFVCGTSCGTNLRHRRRGEGERLRWVGQPADAEGTVVCILTSPWWEWDGVLFRFRWKVLSAPSQKWTTYWAWASESLGFLAWPTKTRSASLNWESHSHIIRLERPALNQLFLWPVTSRYVTPYRKPFLLPRATIITTRKYLHGTKCPTKPRKTPSSSAKSSSGETLKHKARSRVLAKSFTSRAPRRTGHKVAHSNVSQTSW